MKRQTVSSAYGFDRKAFEARLVSASPDERKALWAKYWIWITEGAKAQSWYGPAGGVLLGGATVVAIVGVIAGWAGVYVLVGCALIACVGGFLFHTAAKRERQWRRDNPFVI